MSKELLAAATGNLRRACEDMIALEMIFAEAIAEGPGSDEQKDIARRLWEKTRELHSVLSELLANGRATLAAARAAEYGKPATTS